MGHPPLVCVLYMARTSSTCAEPVLCHRVLPHSERYMRVWGVGHRGWGWL